MCILAIVIASVSLRGPDEADLLAGWELYMARAAYLNGDVHFKLYTDAQAKAYSDNLSRYGQRDGCGFVEHNYRGTTKRTDAQGFNPDYDFSIDQDLTSLKWRLIESHLPDPNKPERTRVANQLDSLKGVMFRLASAEEHLAKDLRAKRFKINSVSVSPDEQWLDIIFLAADVNPAKRRLTREGSIRCYNLPPFYLPVFCEFRTAFPDPDLPQGRTREGTHRHVFEYDRTREIPRLIHARRTRTIPGLKAHSRVDEDIDFNLSDISPPRERFYLTHYGLPEPHGIIAPTPPTPYWLYGTLGSIAVIVLGILLMRWSQRRSARAAA